MTLRLGTRGSALALAQSGWVGRQLTLATGIPVELVVIKTRGDQVQDRPLAQVGGKGLFTKELEEALLAKEVDFAVHSMKDLPGEMPEGLVLAAVPVREDPRDVLVGAPLHELPPGAIVGTGSLRRKLQLLELRPDLDVRGIRGNVDTRIAKQRAGEFHAILLAAAGLARLDRSGDITAYLSIEAMIPAPGQGALAIQSRDEASLVASLARLEHPLTRTAVNAERAFLLTLSGGCSVPAACHAYLHGQQLQVDAYYAADGVRGHRVRLQGRPEDAALLGTKVAHQLMAIS